MARQRREPQEETGSDWPFFEITRTGYRRAFICLGTTLAERAGVSAADRRSPIAHAFLGDDVSGLCGVSLEFLRSLPM
jgi:hypothetical protein